MRLQIIELFVTLCFCGVFTGSVECGVQDANSFGTANKTNSYETDAFRGKFPFLVALVNTENRENNFFCLATLVSSRHANTAAHCICEKNSDDKLEAKNVLAIFGAHNLLDFYESDRILLSPIEIILHKDWNPINVKYEADIAILVFESGKIKFSNFVQPISLLDPSTSFSQTFGTVVGWGKNAETSKAHENVPTLIETQIQANEDCFLALPSLAEISSKQTFCAGLQNKDGFYFGETASGSFINVGSKYFLKGILSTSLIDGGSTEITAHAVYTDVLKYRDWIDDIIGDYKIHSELQPSGEVTCSVQSFQLSDVFLPEESGYAQRNFPETCNIDDQPISAPGYVVKPRPNNAMQAMNVHGHKIKFLPENVGAAFPNLQLVRYAGLSVESLGYEHFKGMHNVKMLFVGHNQIKNVSSSAFKDLRELKRLDLNVNPLQILPEGVFASLVKVETLYLNFNELRTISENIFSKMAMLRRVDLMNNNLSEIRGKLFRNNLNLEYIVLIGNKIQTMDPRFINGLTALKLVSLTSNICVDKHFHTDEFNDLKAHITNHC